MDEIPGTPPDVHMAENESNHEDEIIEMENLREYPFDQLLGDDENDDYYDIENYDGIDVEAEQEQDDEEHYMFDENLGIPRVEAGVPDNDPDDPVEGGNLHGDSPAFSEHPLIRNAYIDAFIQKVVYGATHRALRHQLKTARWTIAANAEVPLESVAKMAQTIKTVESRLGVDLERLITTYTLCPKCGRRYSPEYISTTDEAIRLNLGCEGVLFIVRRLASGVQRRVSNLTYPFASPIAWLNHMLCIPGMSDLIQTWRKDLEIDGDDDWDISAPISSDTWMRNLDMDRPIGDISEGWGWRSTSAGLERRLDPETRNVADVDVLDPPVRFVSLPFGISLSMNTDWFQANKQGCYSVGACYLVVNNLSRHLCFLRQNISLCIVMPGPKEPDHYALDQMMEPLVDELLQLKQGVRMIIRKGDPPVYEEQLVHGELRQDIADLMARIKIGGGAGLKSELNFCLYCHSRLSSLSVAAGYMRNGFRFRDPQQTLNHAYRWQNLNSADDRARLFGQTGIRFTALHRIPGWHTAPSSPPDAMHLLYLGGMNWIVKQVLVAPGLFNQRQQHGPDPQDIFNNCVDMMWVPKSFQRLPPKLGQTQASTKADQWKLTSRILYIPLYLALRDGDEIGAGNVPIGPRTSPAARYCEHRAKLLHKQREKYYTAIGQPDLCPPLAQCASSRNIQFHYRQVLRFCLAVNTIDKRSITPTEIVFAQQLLEALCKSYISNNIPLLPNFHYMMHLEEFMLKTASVYNTHIWGMERANQVVSKINNNGKSKGVLEGTFMRGWWSHATIQTLNAQTGKIDTMRLLPNHTEDDDSIIQDLLEALKGGVENAQENGRLQRFLARCRTAYTKLHVVQEHTRLSPQSRVVNIQELGIYELVVRFCVELWPEAGIFGPGIVRNRYLAHVGMVRNYSYLERDGICYGAYHHTSGKGYCYGYIDNHCDPVRVERILHIEIPGEPVLSCTCALVRHFLVPQIKPRFPWDAWAASLGTASWEYAGLGEIKAISSTRFSGVFALFDIPMSYGRYWVTVALDSVSLEQHWNNEDEEPSLQKK
ncbi:Transposase family tnp2 [Ceratobasidium sp. AG-Ba]|nr:Transposase family tnp2 [Ceratobasidium sp. AG-Ba]